MQLSEAIAKMQAIKDDYGDIPVMCDGVTADRDVMSVATSDVTREDTVVCLIVGDWSDMG